MGRRYPFILILVHFQTVLETQESDLFLGVEWSGFIRDGAYATTRSVLVLSSVRYDG